MRSTDWRVFRDLCVTLRDVLCATKDCRMDFKDENHLAMMLFDPGSTFVVIDNTQIKSTNWQKDVTAYTRHSSCKQLAHPYNENAFSGSMYFRKEWHCSLIVQVSQVCLSHWQWQLIPSYGQLPVFTVIKITFSGTLVEKRRKCAERV